MQYPVGPRDRGWLFSLFCILKQFTKQRKLSVPLIILHLQIYRFLVFPPSQCYGGQSNGQLSFSLFLRTRQVRNCNLQTKRVMKISAMALLAITTLVLITVVIFATLNLPFSWVFYLTTFGQILLVITVIRVLKDDYTTDKTFDDFYEDRPIGKEEVYR